MKMSLKFQSSIGPRLLEKVENEEFFLKFLENFEKMEKKPGRRSCLSSFPSGNQVDGSPLVAIPKQ